MPEETWVHLEGHIFCSPNTDYVPRTLVGAGCCAGEHQRGTTRGPRFPEFLFQNRGLPGGCTR